MTNTLLDLLIVERFGVGAASAAYPDLPTRLFGFRHLALGAILALARKRDPRLLRDLLLVNAGVEFADAIVFSRARSKMAAGAIVGGLGCLLIAALEKKESRHESPAFPSNSFLRRN